MCVYVCVLTLETTIDFQLVHKFICDSFAQFCFYYALIIIIVKGKTGTALFFFMFNVYFNPKISTLTGTPESQKHVWEG